MSASRQRNPASTAGGRFGSARDLLGRRGIRRRERSGGVRRLSGRVIGIVRDLFCLVFRMIPYRDSMAHGLCRAVLL